MSSRTPSDNWTLITRSDARGGSASCTRKHSGVSDAQAESRPHLSQLAQGHVVADRLRQELTQRPLTVDGQAVTVTASIGLAQAAVSMPSFGALMKAADRALYRAKAGGRDRAVAAAPDASAFDLAAE